MKTKIIVLAILILPLMVKAQKNSSEIIKNDATLSLINSALPKAWVMSIENNIMIVERLDSVKIVMGNRFDSPLSKMPKPEREGLIKSQGYSAKSRIIYRIDSLWDINKIIEAKSNNDAIYAKYRELPEKHKIADLKKMGGRNSKAVYQPRNEADIKNIKAYEEEKTALENKLIKLPNFSTKNYSVFFISHEGFDDDNHFVFPEQASIDLFSIENLFRELCGK
ncbi:MAG: hypothetical protein WCK02_17285 [Bacteroidota bacterium]